MKDWDIEKLERYEQQVYIIYDAFDDQERDRKHRLDVESLYEQSKTDMDDRSTYKHSSKEFSATSSKKYQAAKEILENEYQDKTRFSLDIASSELNKVRATLTVKYLQDNNFEKATETLQKLSNFGYTTNQDKEITAAIINFLKNDSSKLSSHINTLYRNKAINKEILQEETIYAALLSNLNVIQPGLKKDLLKIAIESDNIHGVKALVNAGVKISDEELRSYINQNKDINLEIIQATNIVTYDTLHLAIDKGVSKDVIDSLTSKVAPEGLTNDLKYAISEKKIDLQTVLIKKGANINYVDKNGNNFLILAIRNKSAESVQNLLVHGANIHLNEELLKQELANAPQAIKDIVNTYIELENYFKAQVMPEIMAMTNDLDPKQKITNKHVIDKLNEVLDKVYGPSVHKPSNETIKLGFVEKALTLIKAAFESIGSDKIFEQVKFEKMAEAIYQKIQNTEAFKKLAIPAASLNLNEELIIKELTKNAGGLLFKDMTMMGYADLTDKNIGSTAKQISQLVVNSLSKEQGINLSDKVKIKIESAISVQLQEGAKRGFGALESAVDQYRKDNKIPESQTLDHMSTEGDKFIKGVFAKVDFSKMQETIKAAVKDAKMMVDKEVKAAKSVDKEVKDPRIKGKFTAHLVAQENQTSQKGMGIM